MYEYEDQTGYGEDMILPEGWQEGDDIFAGADAAEDGFDGAAGTAAGEGKTSPDDSLSGGGAALPDGGADGRGGGGQDRSGGGDTASGGAEPSGEAEETSRLENELKMARLIYPDLREVPEEVAMAVARGSGFLSAYAAYHARERVRETERLRRENQALRQNQDALRRAPVRGVSGGGGGGSRPLSDFERGFDDDGW